MLAKDIFAVNDIDNKIQDLIGQLNDLIDERLEITSETWPLSKKIKHARGVTSIDLSSIDLSIESNCGLSIKQTAK